MSNVIFIDDYRDEDENIVFTARCGQCGCEEMILVKADVLNNTGRVDCAECGSHMPIRWTQDVPKGNLNG